MYPINFGFDGSGIGSTWGGGGTTSFGLISCLISPTTSFLISVLCFLVCGIGVAVVGFIGTSAFFVPVIGS
ncbi:hypothetical protein NC99_11880 [Sunxiuqinia dokdonensis]|uniref:Uncharacterized protein n=1 Tax=Sunxiuqinia dokdonensis TaxID=1409788 RepID=A0A0L8VCB4_9BACT|nr:hypothetical protein NC99_11880 [Sunxiuqinia dokdonensis]